MRYRTPVIALAGVVLLLSSGVASANSADTSAARSAERQQSAGGGEYMVGFDLASRDAALAAIASAGGLVVDELAQLGLALVETSNADFASTVQSAAGITGVVQNQSIGATEQGRAPVRAKERLTVVDRGAAASRGSAKGTSTPARGADPLESLQWDMAMINASQAQKSATGKKVTVGIIDTGVDASHPDLAPNFSWELSRNFTMDIPEIDDPCEDPTCIDPPWVDDGGHGSHVAGTIAGARNGIGITGVAPDATIVNVRAGQDSGYFFVYETVAALKYAGDAGLDVVNMSFYTDPWLYNCESATDYVSGPVTEDDIAEQSFIRQTVIAALEYAHAHGVTTVAALGNSHTDYAAATRADATSPDYGAPIVSRVVTNNCLDLPTEGPNVISVSAVGPSGTKSDYSNYGLGVADVSAPGGWFRDLIGTPEYRTDANLILSSYPFHVAVEEGYVDADGTPTAEDAYSSCSAPGQCAVWVYLQGTSMASPHVAGEAALVVQAHGKSGKGGYSLSPDTVADIIERTATDHACPVGGTEIYTDEGRPAEFNAPCAGTTADNGLYGEGIINAAAAVAKK